MTREFILLLLGAPLGILVILSGVSYLLARMFDQPDVGCERVGSHQAHA